MAKGLSSHYSFGLARQKASRVITLQLYKEQKLLESLAAGGKPSTWLPPGRLAEHPLRQPRGESSPYGAAPTSHWARHTHAQAETPNRSEVLLAAHMPASILVFEQRQSLRMLYESLFEQRQSLMMLYE